MKRKERKRKRGREREGEKEKDKEKEKEKEGEREEEKDEYVLVGATPKKNVFAKFKKYNETPTNVKSISSGGNGQMQTTQTQTTTQNKTIILKDKTNRYTCEGKLANYSIIKKVDRKVVDKNYALTFADYKKLMYDKNNV